MLLFNVTIMLSNYNYDNKIYPLGDCFGCASKTCVIKCKNNDCTRQMCGPCWNNVIDTTTTCPSCNCNVVSESKKYVKNIEDCCAKHIDILYYSLIICCIIIITIGCYLLFK